jgi:gamma-glutamyltranspeptidase/glutathione hydrolase
VTHPFAGNLGGGGFMLIRLADGSTSFIDFREKAPLKASRDMYLDAGGNPTEESLQGWRAPGVPGTVSGLGLAQQKFGRKSWSELLQPAIHLATEGFPVSHAQMESFHDYADALSRFPESKRIFLKNGAGWDFNETLRQPELAHTLERIARNGPREFYSGETARILAREMASHGGLITLEDLHAYQAEPRTPLETDYKGYHIITSPPPSSGGVGIVQMLAMLNGTGYEKSGANTAVEYHYLAEVMRRSFADRNQYLGDPGFVQIPLDKLLSPLYLNQRRASIDAKLATPSEQVRKPDAAASGCTKESHHTTHFDVADAQGNVVAVTYTLNDGYGSGVTVPGLGFLLNDEMDDFAAKPGCPNLFGLVQGENNAIAPSRRPLSSMTPTIVLKDGKPFLALGAPGGSRIITAVQQVLLNVVDFGMNVQEAIDAPRIHHQWLPDRLEYERGISPDTVRLLQDSGYKTKEMKPEVMACVEAILFADGWMQGGRDGRCNAIAVGY